MIGEHRMTFTLADQYSAGTAEFVITVWNSAPQFVDGAGPNNITIRLNSKQSFSLPTYSDLEGQTVTLRYL